MDKEWDRIGVGYPQMVLSVYGWVDTIQVESWSMKPLLVIVVPFSHQDPGKAMFQGGSISSRSGLFS